MTVYFSDSAIAAINTPALWWKLMNILSIAKSQNTLEKKKVGF